MIWAYIQIYVVQSGMQVSDSGRYPYLWTLEWEESMFKGQREKRIESDKRLEKNLERIGVQDGMGDRSPNQLLAELTAH